MWVSVGIYVNLAIMVKITLDIQTFLIFTITFVVFTAIGTVSHEYGHILVAKSLGYETTLYYGSMTFDGGEINKKRDRIYSEYKNEIDNNVDFEKKAEYESLIKKSISNGFWILLGGPMQTIFTGLIGLIIIFFRKNQIKKFGLRWIDWLAVFLSLFWLREVFNLVMSVAFEIISPNGSYFSGDESNISFLLNLWDGTIPIILGTIGLFISVFVIFRIIPNRLRLTFIASGFLGGILGFILWMYVLGPKLLP